MGESTPSFKIRKKSSLLGCVLELLISTAGGRFPRAWLEPPYASHSGVSRLMGLHYRSSHRRPFAIPANVFGGASNRNVFDGTSSAQSQSQESPPSVPINDAVLRIMNKLKHLWN